VSLLLLHRTGFDTSKYFTSSSAVWTEAIGQGLLVHTQCHSPRRPFLMPFLLLAHSRAPLVRPSVLCALLDVRSPGVVLRDDAW
jgi:hypothetical protein